MKLPITRRKVLLGMLALPLLAAVGTPAALVQQAVRPKVAKLTPADMLGKEGYVPSGVVEITQKQMQGWAYLRP